MSKNIYFKMTHGHSCEGTSFKIKNFLEKPPTLIISLQKCLSKCSKTFKILLWPIFFSFIALTSLDIFKNFLKLHFDP